MPYIDPNIATAERYCATRPIGYVMTDGETELERLDDIDGEPNWHMRPAGDEAWCGGIAEAASFAVVDLGFDAADYRPEDLA